MGVVNAQLFSFEPRHEMEKSGQPHAPAALLTRKESPGPIEKEARWAPEPVWKFWRKKKSFPVLQVEIRIVLSVACQTTLSGNNNNNNHLEVMDFLKCISQQQIVAYGQARFVMINARKQRKTTSMHTEVNCSRVMKLVKIL
jgi:hypothetical protein